MSPIISFIVIAQDDVDALESTLQSIAIATAPSLFPCETLVMFESTHSTNWDVLPAVCAANNAQFIVHTPAEYFNMLERAREIARGAFVWFINSGDKLPLHATSRAIEAIERKSANIGSYGRILRVDEKNSLVDSRRWPLCEDAVDGNLLPALMQGKELLITGNVCLRKAALYKVELPIGLSGGRDWLLFCRLAAQGQFAFIGDYHVVARYDANARAEDVYCTPPPSRHVLEMGFRDASIQAVVDSSDLATYRKKWSARLKHARRTDGKDEYTAIETLQQRFKQTMFMSGGVLRATPLEQIPRRVRDGRIRILHVIKYFYAGGCERLLRSLLENTDTDRYEHIILSLSDLKERMEEVAAMLGVPYYVINMPHELHLSHHVQCFLMMQHIEPDVIKTWLNPSNISGGTLGFLLKKPVIWGIHNYISAMAEDRMEFELSHHIPRRIICCSHPIRDAAAEYGYPEEYLEVIENGTDVEQFQHSSSGRKAVRKELGIAPGTFIIGMAAEYQELKRHRYFLLAAQNLLRTHPDTVFLLCGKRVSDENGHLHAQLTTLGISRNVLTLGVRNDMPDIYSAMDVHTLCPISEPFGLAVIEAMACETFTVTMNVIPEIVQDVGIVVNHSENPKMLADAWREAIAMPAKERLARGKQSRERIATKYSIAETTRKYDTMFERVFQNYQSGKEGAL